VKNKVAAPFREAEFDIIYGEGVSREGDLLDLGVAKNIIEKSGTWISYKGERIGQGRENARVFLKENADIRNKIEHDLRKALGLVSHTAADEAKAAQSEADGHKPASKAAAAAGQARSNR
jgi:recombination protein RecA